MNKRYKLMKLSVQKYRLTNRTTWHHSGRTLYQIQALKSFGDVKAGDFGGWIESYDNLSQFDNCWIYENAKVFGNAKVSDDAVVKENAIVSGNALIYDFAQVYGNATVYGNVRIFNRAQVYGHSKIYGKAKVYDNVRIFDQAKIYGYNTRISGNAYICNNNVVIASTRDYLVLHTNWSDKDYVTYTHSNNMYKAYDFYGSAEELLKKVYKESQWKGDCYKNMVESVERLYAIFDQAEKQN